MKKYRRISIIIPLFNEERTIQELIQRVQNVNLNGLEKDIVVVDDGSQDRTAELLRKINGIRYFTNLRNQGKGAAIKTGIRHATGEIFLIQDADLEYDPRDYPVILKPILEGKVEFVMGSRFLVEKPRFFTKKGAPFFSHYVGNLMVIAWTNFLYGQRKTDYEGCYKAFTRTLKEWIPIETNGFDFDNELICKALRRGHEIAEVPIRYKPRLYKEGKKIRWQDGVRILWSIFKWRFLPF